MINVWAGAKCISLIAIFPEKRFLANLAYIALLFLSFALIELLLLNLLLHLLRVLELYASGLLLLLFLSLCRKGLLFLTNLLRNRRLLSLESLFSALGCLFLLPFHLCLPLTLPLLGLLFVL